MPTKYKSKPVELDGIRFSSIKEAKRYRDLKLLQSAGKIANLRLQVPYELAPKVKIAGDKRARPAIRFYADFVYQQEGREVVEDAKGMRLPMYKLKRHLMATVFGIHVQEV